MPNDARPLGALVSGSVLVLGASTRAITRREGLGPQFLSVTLAVLGCALAITLVQARWAPGVQPRHRAATLAALRVTVALLGAIPFPIPEPPSTSCGGYFFFWLTNSGALAAFFLALAASVPSAGANLALGLVQQAALAWVAGVRCDVLAPGQPPRPGVSLVQADPGRCLAPLAQLLDWPFHLSFPEAMRDASVELSRPATCLACTLWCQLMLTLVLPTALLFDPASARGAHRAVREAALGEAAPPAASSGRASRRRLATGTDRGAAQAVAQDSSGSGEGGGGTREGGGEAAGGGIVAACTALWLGDQPVLGTLCAGQILWIVLRTACTL